MHYLHARPATMGNVPNEQELHEFGEKLRALRATRDRATIMDALRDREPEAPKTVQALEAWEAGRNAPSRVEFVWALEDIYRVRPGTLTELLKWGRRPVERALDWTEHRKIELRRRVLADKSDAEQLLNDVDALLLELED